jgi:Na+/phosphate symporter
VLSGNFEDNIYIDCVPVEQSQKPKDYMKQTNTKLSLGFNPSNLISMLVVAAYVILIFLIVYGIYSLAIYLNNTFKPKASQTVAQPAAQSGAQPAAQQAATSG